MTISKVMRDGVKHIVRLKLEIEDSSTDARPCITEKDINVFIDGLNPPPDECTKVGGIDMNLRIVVVQFEIMNDDVSIDEIIAEIKKSLDSRPIPQFQFHCNAIDIRRGMEAHNTSHITLSIRTEPDPVSKFVDELLEDLDNEFDHSTYIRHLRNLCIKLYSFKSILNYDNPKAHQELGHKFFEYAFIDPSLPDTSQPRFFFLNKSIYTKPKIELYVKSPNSKQYLYCTCK